LADEMRVRGALRRPAPLPPPPGRLASNVRRILRRYNWDVVRWTGPSHPLGKRIRLLRHFGVTTIFDVGANEGQFAREMRLAGFGGRMVSFEPLAGPFSVLASGAARDPLWEAHHLGLGDADGNVAMNIALNSISSSALPMLPAHFEAAIDPEYTGIETCRFRRLDSIYTKHAKGDERVALKIDVQGFELRVLEGAAGVLDNITGIQVELSLLPLYDGAPSFDEVVHWLADRGFVLMGLEPGFYDRITCRLLQCDAIFYRE
jgi:FkbM family methyltransferase